MISEPKVVNILKYTAIVILSYVLSFYINYYTFDSKHGMIFISLIIFICIYKLFFQTIDYINIDNKAVLITGCDSGIGYNTALRLNDKGFRVYATLLNESTDLIENSRFRDQMIVMKMDVRYDDEIKNVYKYISDDINESNYVLWSVINNAAVEENCPINWGSFDHCFNIINTNLLGTIRVTRAFIPLIHKSKGRIVNLSSLAGCTALENYCAYCTSKHGIKAFTNCLRLEMKKFGIKVLTIMPGPFKTFGSEPENIIRNLKTNWNNTDEEVKNMYGNENFDKYVNLFNKTYEKMPLSSNIDLVSYDIIDALINANPKIRYKPTDGFIMKFILFIFEYFPYCILEALPDFI